MKKTTARTSSTTGAALALLALSGAASGILAIPASAQSDVSIRLRQCAELPDDAERLACYDQLTAIAADTDTDAAEDVEPGSPSVTPAVTAGAVEPVAAVTSPAPAVADVPPTPVPESSPHEESQALETATENDDPEIITVISLRRNLSGFAVFETAEGEVWIQTDLTNRSFPPTPFSARVERAVLRGYFLRVEDGGFRIRARRLQ